MLVGALIVIKRFRATSTSPGLVAKILFFVSIQFSETKVIEICKWNNTLGEQEKVKKDGKLEAFFQWR